MTMLFSSIAAKFRAPAPLKLGTAFAMASALALTAPAQAADIDVEPSGFAVQAENATSKLLLDAAKAGDRLVAVGEFGHIVLSDDGGKTWTQAKEVRSQVALNSVMFVNDKVGFAAGHDATVLKTTDGGETWRVFYRDTEFENPLLAVHFEDENKGYAVGAFSLMVETMDGGETWKTRPVFEGNPNDYHLNDIYRSKAGTLLIPSEFGIVYRSTDGGASFEEIQTDYEGSFWSGLGLSDGSILVYGMRGNIYRSVDEGLTWQPVEADTQKSFGGGVELDDGTVVLSGLNGAVAYSTDMGKSFKTYSRPDRAGFNAVIGGADDTIIIFGVPGLKVMPDTFDAANGAS
ncbi:MAG: YCF48-related protein [Parvibaculaceae bacterium]|nr:YCF48-related protein [Parvibaculaceae bacterium]